jgi:hypothetical protein
MIKYTEITKELDNLLKKSRLSIYTDRDMIAHNRGRFLCFDYNDYVFIRKNQPCIEDYSLKLSNINFVKFLSKYCYEKNIGRLPLNTEKEEGYVARLIEEDEENDVRLFLEKLKEKEEEHTQLDQLKFSNQYLAKAVLGKLDKLSKKFIENGWVKADTLKNKEQKQYSKCSNLTGDIPHGIHECKDEMGYLPDQKLWTDWCLRNKNKELIIQKNEQPGYAWENLEVFTNKNLGVPLEGKHDWITEERIRECCGKWIEKSIEKPITVTPDCLYFYNYHCDFLKSFVNCKKIEPMPECEIQKWIEKIWPSKKESYNIPYPLLAGILD